MLGKSPRTLNGDVLQLRAIEVTIAEFCVNRTCHSHLVQDTGRCGDDVLSVLVIFHVGILIRRTRPAAGKGCKQSGFTTELCLYTAAPTRVLPGCHMPWTPRSTPAAARSGKSRISGGSLIKRWDQAGCSLLKYGPCISALVFTDYEVIFGRYEYAFKRVSTEYFLPKYCRPLLEVTWK